MTGTLQAGLLCIGSAIATPSAAQTVDLAELRIRGVPPTARRAAVGAAFGLPDSLALTYAECGAFGPGHIRTLCYPGVRYARTSDEGDTADANAEFRLARLRFSPGDGFAVEYRGRSLSAETSFTELNFAFGKPLQIIRGDRTEGHAMVWCRGYDAALIARWRGGYLVELEYWEPC